MSGAVTGETKRVVTKTAVLGMTNKQPPSLMLRKRVVGAGGAARYVTLLVPVLDPDLLLRLSTEVHPGDEVEATVVNIWREDGYTTHLENFRKILAEEAPAAKELAAQAA